MERIDLSAETSWDDYSLETLEAIYHLCVEKTRVPHDEYDKLTLEIVPALARKKSLA